MVESEGRIPMTKCFAFVAVFALSLSFLGQAIAGETTPSADALRAAIQKNKESAATLANKFRDVQCRQQTSALESVCENAYNMIIARLDAARAELEVILAASQLPEPVRSQILKVVQNPATFNRNNRENVALTDQVYFLFPVRRQSSTTGQR